MSLNKGKILDLKFDRFKTGVELILNGGFDSTDDWTTSLVVIDSGVATYTADGSNTPYIDQAVSVTNGKKYVLKYEIVSNTLVGGTTLWTSGVGFTGSLFSLPSTVGVHSVTVACIDDTATLRLVVRNSSTSGTLVLDNISLRELKQTDATPYENDGTMYNLTYGTDRKGNSNKAGVFNGTSSYVRISDSTEFNIGSYLSVFTWVKGISATSYVMGQYDSGTSQRAWSIRNYNGYFRAIISDDGTLDSGHYKDYRVLSFDDTWHRIGFTFNAGVFKLYIDGVEQTTIKTTDDAITSIHNSTADMTIGCSLDSDSPSGFYTGSIDGTQVYNRVLTDAEILLDAQSYNPALGVGEKGLVLDMPMSSEWTKSTGVDLLSGWDFTSGWSTTAAATINDANTFTTTGDGGIYKALLTSGKRYFLKVEGTSTADFEVRNGTAGSIQLIDGFGQVEFTTGGSEPTIIYLRNRNSAGTTDITTLTIKEISLTDKTPYSNDGTINGATFTTDRKGHANKAMLFTSANSNYISLEDKASNRLSSITMCAWIKGNIGSTATPKIISKRNGLNFYFIGLATGTPYVGFGDGTARTFNSSGGAIDNTNWHFIAASLDATTLQATICVDGVCNSTTLAGGIGNLTGEPVFIGGEAPSGGAAPTSNFYDGSIGRVKIFNRALSSTELEKEYYKYN